jgi:hypothetical protein
MRVHIAPVDLVGLGVELTGHQTKALGATQVKAAPGDAETVFGLAAEKIRSDHGR